MDGGVSGQMGRFGGERIGIPAEYDRRRTERQAAIDPAEALQKPAAEKAGTAGYENTFSTDLFQLSLIHISAIGAISGGVRTPVQDRA